MSDEQSGVSVRPADGNQAGWTFFRGGSQRRAILIYLIESSFECGQCFITHVVLDPFGVTFRGFLADSEAEEERHNDPVPPPASLRQRLASLSQEHCAVSLAANETGCPEA